MRPSLPAVALTASAALVTGLVTWGSTGQVAGPPDTEALRYVPEDGTRSVWEDGEGRVSVTEDARLDGIPALLSTPPLVGNALFERLDGEPADWRLWRHTTTTYDVADGDSGEQSTTLYRLTEDGVEQVASYGAFTLVFDPPVLALPADAEDGSTWDGTGDASTDGSLTYAFDASAEGVEDDCLRITGTLAIQQEGDDLGELDVDETWCADGPLHLDDDEPADPPPLDGGTDPQVGLASGAEDWVAHPRPLTIATSLEEAGGDDPAASATVDFAPAGTGAGGLAITNSATGDLDGFVADGDRLARGWVGHPGGDVTSVATSGEVSVVGTSRRELVGYGPRGQWLWTTDLGGVPVATPLAADGDRLVAGTVSGDVVALDPATGEIAWRGAMTDAVRRTPVTDGDTVAAVDAAGHVTAWDLDSGAELWSDDIRFGGALGIAGSVLGVRGENSVVALDLRTGERRWSTRVGTATGGAAVVGTGRTLTVADSERTVGLDRETGELLWERHGAEETIGLDARSVQVTDDDELVVRDGDGELLTRLDLEGLLGSTRWLAPADVGVWVADSFGQVLEVSPCSTQPPGGPVGAAVAVVAEVVTTVLVEPVRQGRLRGTGWPPGLAAVVGLALSGMVVAAAVVLSAPLQRRYGSVGVYLNGDLVFPRWTVGLFLVLVVLTVSLLFTACLHLAWWLRLGAWVLVVVLLHGLVLQPPDSALAPNVVVWVACGGLLALTIARWRASFRWWEFATTFVVIGVATGLALRLTVEEQLRVRLRRRPARADPGPQR